MDDPESLDAVSDAWYPEVLHYYSKSKVPILLVGCKTDLRRNLGSPPNGDTLKKEITAQQGQVMEEQIEAVGCLECSPKTREGNDEALMMIARVIIPLGSLRPRSRKRVVPYNPLFNRHICLQSIKAIPANQL